MLLPPQSLFVLGFDLPGTVKHVGKFGSMDFSTLCVCGLSALIVFTMRRDPGRNFRSTPVLAKPYKLSTAITRPRREHPSADSSQLIQLLFDIVRQCMCICRGSRSTDKDMIRNLCDFVGHAIVPVETRESAPTTTPLARMVVPVETSPGFNDFS